MWRTTPSDVLKGVLTRGTGRKGRLDGDRPAAGKTGTQAFNTNAWFVGATPNYTTAVWVGDPKGQTRMRNIPEFRAQGVNPRARRRLSGPDLEVLHGGHPRGDPARGLARARAHPWPAPHLPARARSASSGSGRPRSIRTLRSIPMPRRPIPTRRHRWCRSASTRRRRGPRSRRTLLDMGWPLTSVPASTPVFSCRSGPPKPPPPPAPAPPRDGGGRHQETLLALQELDTAHRPAAAPAGPSA